jgi:hypothetical protein
MTQQGDSREIAQMASRALNDPEFARQILEGNPDYPEVREAILKDLAEGHGQSDVQGFYQTLQGLNTYQLLQGYIVAGPKPGGNYLSALANVSACW